MHIFKNLGPALTHTDTSVPKYSGEVTEAVEQGSFFYLSPHYNITPVLTHPFAVSTSKKKKKGREKEKEKEKRKRNGLKSSGIIVQAMNSSGICGGK